MEQQITDLLLAGSLVSFSMGVTFNVIGRIPRIVYNLLANDWSK